MAQLIENNDPYVKNNKGITTNYPLSLNGAAANLTIGGNVTVAGNLTGGVLVPVTQSALVGATVVLTAAQSGGAFQNRSTSGSPSWTLPTCANGLEYTFTTASTSTGFTITGAQVIHAKTSATGTAITSTTTITNTQGTAVVGDALTIVGDGTAWWMTAQSGIFAAS